MKKIVAIIFSITLCFGSLCVNSSNVKAASVNINSGQSLFYYLTDPENGETYGPGAASIEDGMVILQHDMNINDNLIFENSEDIDFFLNGHNFNMGVNLIKVDCGEKAVRFANTSENPCTIQTRPTNDSDGITVDSGTFVLNGVNYNYDSEWYADEGCAAAIQSNSGKVIIENSNLYSPKRHLFYATGGTIDIENSTLKEKDTPQTIIETEDINDVVNLTLKNSDVVLDAEETGIANDGIIMNENDSSKGTTVTIDGGLIQGVNILAKDNNSKLTYNQKAGTIEDGIRIDGRPTVSISGGNFKGGWYSMSVEYGGNLYDYIHKDYYLAQGGFAIYGGSRPTLCPGDSTVVPKKKNAVLNKKSYVYNGKKQIPTVTVYDVFGNKLKQGKDYKISNSSWADVGTWSNYVEYIGDYKGVAKDELKYSITKANSPMKVTAKKTISFSLKKIKKKRYQTKKKVIKAKNFKCNWATYKKVKGNKHINIWSTSNSKACNVTVYKGIKKGTYKIKVRVDDAGSGNYKSKKVYKTIKVKIKK